MFAVEKAPSVRQGMWKVAPWKLASLAASSEPSTGPYPAVHVPQAPSPIEKQSNLSRPGSCSSRSGEHTGIPPSVASAASHAQTEPLPHREGWSSSSSTASYSSSAWFVPDDPTPSYIPFGLLGPERRKSKAKSEVSPRKTARAIFAPPEEARRRRSRHPSTKDSQASSPAAAKARRLRCHRTEDSDTDSLEMQPDVEIIIGPTSLAFGSLSPSTIELPSTGVEGTAALKSHSKQLSVGDCLRLASAGTAAPMSFGSALHITGVEGRCRPCMFEHWPGRCKKSWLCDFCHSHEFREVRASSKKTRKANKEAQR